MPHTKQGLRLDLRTLILILSALTALVMLCTSYFASYRVQRQLLIDHALESNRVYAAKLASITETFLSGALQHLGVSAKVQGRQINDASALRSETDRLLQESNAFNSTFVVDAQGTLQAVSPESLHQMVGKKLQSPGSQEALQGRKPIVSMPFLSAANNLVVVLSQPIFDDSGQYLGYVAGTLYLREHNILNNLLGLHYYKDGSYLYVVDRNLRLLYHPEPQRVGTLVKGNALLDNLTTESNGARAVTNSYGVEMLAGFATVPSTGWGVVAQQPLEKTLTPLHSLILSVIGLSAPLVLLGSLIMWWLALTIARPLWQLAAGAREMDQPDTRDDIRGVRAWYFEAAELKRALLFGLNLLQERIGRLNRDAQTDPLTGLINRRGLESSLSLLQTEGRGFSAIALDIDHFKRINDSHGHDVGDVVLRRLAELMRGCCRDGDLLCRTGGEEFLMLLPSASLEVALTVAERLRLCVQDTPIEPVKVMTISLGVAQWRPEIGETPLQVLSKADQALYLAKQSGRNCVKAEEHAIHVAS